MVKKLEPIKPGEILLEEFMIPYGVTQNKLARDIDVPAGRINDIIHGNRSITIDSALRFSVYFKTTPEFWLNLQTSYDLKLAKENLLPQIEENIRPISKIAA